MKRYIIKIIFLISLLMCINVYSNATSGTSIELECDSNSIEPNSEIQVEVKIKNQTTAISSFDAFIQYDENIFEQVKQEDITTQINKDYIDTFTYSQENKKILMSFSDCLDNIDTIITIKLRIKDNIVTQNNIEIYLHKASIYNVDTDEYLLEEVESSRLSLKIGENDNLLNLTTTKYKIGEENTQEYTKGDKYICKIAPKTSITNFLDNLSTNGNISVYNADREEQANLDELIKTGMRVKVTKQDCPDIIELTTIVMGDANANGKIDMGDTTILRAKLYEGTQLTELESKALDIKFTQIINTSILTIIRNVLYEGGIIENLV